MILDNKKKMIWIISDLIVQGLSPELTFPHLVCPGCSLKTAQHWGCRPRTFKALIRQPCRVKPGRTCTCGEKQKMYCILAFIFLLIRSLGDEKISFCQTEKRTTYHSALLVREVDADSAARLWVGHFAIIRGATIRIALHHGWGEARALEVSVFHTEAVAQGPPCSLKVLH